jgi:20S proteasome alpha/beta subunit
MSVDNDENESQYELSISRSTEVHYRRQIWHGRRLGCLRRRCTALYVLVSVGTIILFALVEIERCAVDASQAAATETLIGIVGDGFILLGADSSVSSSLSLTSSNVDKISVLVDPRIDANLSGSDGTAKNKRVIRVSSDTFLTRAPLSMRRQLPIVAAAAGDAADTDRLIEILKSLAAVEEYSSTGCWSADVQVWDVVRTVKPTNLNEDNDDDDSDATFYDEKIRDSRTPFHSNEAGHEVHSLAQITRQYIADAARSRSPLRVCLLMAGMKLVHTGTIDADHGSSTISQLTKQVKQAHSHFHDMMAAKVSSDIMSNSATLRNLQALSKFHESRTHYRPYLYWLDEYGSCQQVQYGAHGYGSNFCLSVLDRDYREQMTKEDAIGLMKDCFRQLRMRYVINSGPQPPCIKYVDENGVSEICDIDI